MKLEKNYLLLCENFVLDDKQRASLINLYDIIWAQNIPALHSKLLYVANVKVSDSGSQKKLLMVLELKSPSGKTIFTANANEARITQNTKTQFVGGAFEIGMVPFQEYGAYRAILKVEGKEIADHIFELKKPIPEEK